VIFSCFAFNSFTFCHKIMRLVCCTSIGCNVKTHDFLPTTTAHQSAKDTWLRCKFESSVLDELTSCRRLKLWLSGDWDAYYSGGVMCYGHQDRLVE